MEEEYKLYDNKDKSQYEFHIEEYIPKIEYIKTNNSEIILTHTEVPSAIGGNGVGTQLVKETLIDIDRQGLHLVPLCPFVVGYIRQNPEWERLVRR